MQASGFLNTTLCTGQCVHDCKSYVTPTSKCFNPDCLFPGDPSWSGLDMLDTIVGNTIMRTIFRTSDTTCLPTDQDDHFQIPLNECVGPFGEPRPWGELQLLDGDDRSRIHYDGTIRSPDFC